MDPHARLVLVATVSACAAWFACAACSGSPGSARSEEARATAASPIIGGTTSDSSQDEVVLIVHHSPGAEVGEVCSGTLLAPNLVLTARHCVADADTTSECTADGTSAVGGKVYADYEPNDLYVFAGAKRPTGSSLVDVSQRGSAIIDDGATTLCNHDLALVLLATPVPDAKIAPVRLDSKARLDEPVTVVGWGITDDTSKVPTTRQQRTDASVLAVGPKDYLGVAELAISEGPCEGDSGGPALAASGAVIGALSRGGNGSEDGGASACVGATSVYTAVSGFKELVLSAYARAGQEPWLEDQAGPTEAQAAAQPSAPAPDNGGCAIADRSGGAGGRWAIPVVLALIWYRRSRRLSSRARA